MLTTLGPQSPRRLCGEYVVRVEGLVVAGTMHRSLALALASAPAAALGSGPRRWPVPPFGVLPEEIGDTTMEKRIRNAAEGGCNYRQQ